MTQTSHELTLTRFIAAPPSKVWEVMAERQSEWWSPRPGAPKWTFRIGGRAGLAA